MAKDEKAGVGRRADDPIALGLRKLWADVEQEDVPDHFLDLLDRIDDHRATAPSESSGAENPAATALEDGPRRAGGDRL